MMDGFGPLNMALCNISSACRRAWAMGVLAHGFLVHFPAFGFQGGCL